jgi:fructosamine-3-kinase
MKQNLAAEIGARLDREPPSLTPLHGGMIGQVYAASWPNGDRLVAKVDAGANPQLDIEGYMLRYLAEQSELPVPALYVCNSDLLVMEHVAGSSHFDAATEAHAAELLAALHEVRGPACGLERDTLIGALHQPNPWTDSWVDFFAEQRLLYLGQLGVKMGRMPGTLLKRIEALCDRLGDFISEPAQPSLVHGDVWASNVLTQDGRVTGFLDPAIYFGHPEVELAYIFLFHTFGDQFLDRYQALRPLEPDFFERRIYVYQLYPLLSHVCHFGGGYVQSTEQTLTRLGM